MLSLASIGLQAQYYAMQTVFQISTNGPGLYEFTDQVNDWVHSTGLLTLFVQHTSASLLIQENADPEVCVDMQNFFHRLVPLTTDPSMAYLTHTYEGPDDMPAHIKAALLPVQLSIPVTQGRLALGTWQGIYLFEHRDAAHRRRVVAHLSS
jgi:secondary thiamine-phosphate synthase enzyme